MPKIIKSIASIFFLLVFALFFVFYCFNSLQLVEPMYADYQCNNGPNNRDSNGCGDACYYGDAWSKYWKYACVGGWCFNYLGSICSTGDKCVSQEKGLRPGYCDCGSSGPLYKSCCSGSTAVSCVKYGVQDNFDPPEGTCPSGSTIVYGTSCTSSTPPANPGGGCLVYPYNNSCPRGYVLSGGCCICP